ncbi:MAG: hypothetical protein K6G07_02230 [Lachnospiraceae bacterium]|nr:hypothetical protein [Lachnospiraceae bacterium]
MKKLSRNIKIALLVFLAGVLSFLFSVTVYSGGKSDYTERELRRMDEAECEYLKEIKGALQEAGYCRSGVTMTKILEEDGSVYYDVDVHNRLFANASYEKKAELETVLCEIAPSLTGRDCEVMLELTY